MIYIYDLNNALKGRIINGVTQNFVYDKKGQLTGVTDSNGTILESYKYDAAGNILEKVINGAAVNYTYDKANQLLTATMPDGIRKSYKYDAAGRLVEETAGTSSKLYSYGWSDKVTKVTDGKGDTNFSYYPNGQLAKRSTDKASENFYWDGLALLKRDNTNYMNEPYVTGGNPVLADDKLVFNDMLGTSIGSMEDGNFKYIPRTAFGETEDKSDVNFFTGKPDVADLGYNFMFRNYRADLGKWQTQDPLGYPDGWNNFAYCNNGTTSRFDALGLDWIDSIVSSIANYYAQDIINSVVTSAMAHVSKNCDVNVLITNLDLSGLSITFDYTNAWSLFFIPLGSGTGTIDPNSITTPNENYSNTFTRTSPEIYTVYDESYNANIKDSSLSVMQIIAVNKTYGSWYSFSSLTVTNVYISGIIKFDTITVIVDKYKE